MQFAVYSAGDCNDFGTFSELGCFSNSPVGEKTVGSLTVGMTYYVQVDGFLSAEGTFCIAVEDCPEPTNDNACNATMLTLGDACTGNPYSNTCALSAINEPFPACFSGGTDDLESVWFSFVAPASERVKVLVNGGTLSSLDLQFAVYTASDCSDLLSFTELACYADNHGYLIVPDLMAGSTYYIQFDGRHHNDGTFCIELEDCPPPANEEVCNATLLTLGNTCVGMPYSTGCALPEANEPTPSCFLGSDLNSVWFKYVAPASGRVSITMETATSGETGDLQAAVYAAADCNDFNTFSELRCTGDWSTDSIVVDGV
jgi:hypothetical protein